MNWPNGTTINGIDSTLWTPASCVFNNQLFLFWQSTTSTEIFFSASADGTAWPAGTVLLGPSTTAAPVACVFNGKLFVFWRDVLGHIYFSSSADGKTWPTGSPINGTDTTPGAVAACVFNGQLFVFWKANDSSNKIFFSASGNGTSWPGGEVINGTDSTPDALAACVFNNQLFLFWKANDSSNGIFFSASGDGTAWPAGQRINGSDSTPNSLGACVFNGQIFLFWQANDSSNRIFFSASSNGTGWPGGQTIDGSDSTSQPVSAAVFNNELFLFWKANDSSNTIFFSGAGATSVTTYTEALFEFWTTDDDLRQDSALSAIFWGPVQAVVDPPPPTELTSILLVKAFGAPKYDNWTYNSAIVPLSSGLTLSELGSCELILSQGGTGVGESSDEWHVGAIHITLQVPGTTLTKLVCSAGDGAVRGEPLQSESGYQAATQWVINQAHPWISVPLQQ